MVMRQTKRASSLKEPSHSTWEDLFYFEEDLVERVGKDSFGMILGSLEM
jgi:hypothetical protein